MRAAEYIFAQARMIKQFTITVRFSAVEIYNNIMIDLLRDTAAGNINAPKLIILDTPSGVIVPALHTMPADTVDEAYALLSEANINR
jgi:hypothetical protein